MAVLVSEQETIPDTGPDQGACWVGSSAAGTVSQPVGSSLTYYCVNNNNILCTFALNPDGNGRSSTLCFEQLAWPSTQGSSRNTQYELP
jgi:hypothetical protein